MKKKRFVDPEHDLWVAYIREDPRFTSKRIEDQQELVRELEEGGFPEEFIKERLPELIPHLSQIHPRRRAVPRTSSTGTS